MQKKTIFILFLLFCYSMDTLAQRINKQSIPFVGAQIFIEPGQTEAQVEQWFKLLKESNLTTCRIRMFGKYMKGKNGTYDFSLFDTAFNMADKYDIKVYATLFPDTDFMDVGGFKFPRSNTHQQEIADYIKNVVSHFSKFKCLATWVLINEPGTTNLPYNEEFTKEHFVQWETENKFSEYNDAGYPILNFEKEKFILDFHNWYLNWLAQQVRLYDKHSDLHVNPHNVFNLCELYDFPTWRAFLNSFGGSAHASWHFGYFPRASYAVAMSANAELLRSGAGKLPWLMTELQGGNNIYSGASPMCPTAEEITQWLWINYATEAKGNIFWSFNGRATAAEAGEWALINFKNQASDRLVAASAVGDFIAKHKKMMSNIRTINSGISILYNHESLWVEKSQARGRKDGNGRSVGATMRSALAYFEALSEAGLQANIKEFKEFDFSQKDYTGQVIILSHQVAIDNTFIKQLEQFVAKGGTLIADGLTGFYDYNAHSTAVSGFASEKLFGALPIEFKKQDNIFSLNVAKNDYQLPAHYWKGFIETTTATPILDTDGNCVAAINQLDKGKVYWIASPLALGAREAKDYSALSNFTMAILSATLVNQTPRFDKHYAGMLMKSFVSGEKNYSLVINKSERTQTVTIEGIEGKTSIIFSNKNAYTTTNQLTIYPEETVVLEWQK